MHYDSLHEEEYPPTLMWFQELLKAMVCLDDRGAEGARRKLAYRGWKVWHPQFPYVLGTARARAEAGDRRRLLRIWDVALRSPATSHDIASWVSRGDAPPPTEYDEVGPAWHPDVVQAWLCRKETT